MSDFDDELAELLALQALSELATTAPPAELRADALRQAMQRRAPGRPVDAAVPCPPAEVFDRTITDVYELLKSLSAAEWDAPAHDEHGRVRDLVAHLVGVERLSLRWLDPDDDMPLVLDHVAATRPVVESLAGVAAPDLVREWYEAVRAVAAAAACGDLNRQVTFHDLSSSIDGFLITRSFELWAHSMDIAAATGRPMPELDPERMATLSQALIDVVPFALAYRRSTAPGRTARFVLTGSAGGCYNVALDPQTSPGAPDVVIVADTLDLCRLAARRLTPAELDSGVEGDRGLGALVLAGLDAFARD